MHVRRQRRQEADCVGKGRGGLDLGGGEDGGGANGAAQIRLMQMEKGPLVCWDHSGNTVCCRLPAADAL